jgi:hypothetical protein
MLFCNDTRLEDSTFRDHVRAAGVGAGIFLRAVVGLAVTNCHFYRTNSAWNSPLAGASATANFVTRVASGPSVFLSRNVVFSDCTFLDSSVQTTSVNNIVFSRSSFTITDPNYVAYFIEFTGQSNDFPLNGATVRDCAFSNLNPHPVFDGLVMYRARGVVVENSRITIQSTGYGPQAPFGIIQTGAIRVNIHNSARRQGAALVTSVENVVIKNVDIEGGFSHGTTTAQTIGILVETNSRAIIIDSVRIRNTGPGKAANGSVQAQMPAGILIEGGASVTIRDVIVQNATGGEVPGNGIVFRGAFNGTVLPDFGSGTFAVPEASRCLLKDSISSFNAGNGVVNDGTFIFLSGNIAYANTLSDYSGAGTPSPVIVAAGGDALAGQNV